nr:hypothetical protein [uncultured Acetatifactor sp.]
MEGNRTRFPRQGTLGYLLLELTAICGEFPADLLPRIPGTTSYKRKVLWSLKKDGLLRTYYQNKLRGYRLGRKAKEYLLADRPERFSFYLTGNKDTNLLKSEVSRRLRLHRIAEVHAAMMNAGVAVFRDEKPSIFTSEEPFASRLEFPAFYGSREIKEMGVETVKIRGSRMAGVLLAPSGIFLVYNCGPYGAVMDYRAEQRAQVLMELVLCRRRFPGQYGDRGVSGLLFGDGLESFYRILTESDSRSRCFFLLDGNYEHFYYLTNDHRGEVLLRLLCDMGRRAELDRILMQGLCEGNAGFTAENDAMDEAGCPVLFGYFLDIPRINRFCTALQIQDRKGTLICFDFQREVLERFCGGWVELSAISFEKFERRFFP